MVVGDVEVFQQLPPRRLVGAGDVAIPLPRPVLPLPRSLVGAGDVVIPLLR